jgi:hypothetical protein
MPPQAPSQVELTGLNEKMSALSIRAVSDTEPDVPRDAGLSIGHAG